MNVVITNDSKLITIQNTRRITKEEKLKIDKEGDEIIYNNQNAIKLFITFRNILKNHLKQTDDTYKTYANK